MSLSRIFSVLFSEHPMDIVFMFGACGPNADENKANNIKSKLGDFRNKERFGEGRPFDKALEIIL